MTQPEELGTTTPYATESPAGTDNRAISRLLFGLGLLIVILCAAAYALFGRETTSGAPVAATDRPTHTRTPAPSRTTAPRATPAVPVIPMPPQIDTTGPAEPTAVAGGGSISLSGIAEHRTVTCTGGAVEISGINNTVEITGHCDRVGVSGIENIVTLESADVIEASGISNRVTYHSGDPRIDSSGSDVTVTQG